MPQGHLNTDPESLIAEITAAFNGVPREDGTTLHEAEEMDCWGSPEELLQARQLDTDTRWQDIPEKWIGDFPSAFRYMDPKGLRYYLPAVMLWHFKHTHWSEPASADCVVTLLTNNELGYLHLPELLNLLTLPQCRATARWLYLYLSDYNEPEKHIEALCASCWGAFLSVH